MKQITESEYNLLKHEIYMTLIAGYDNEGNELGMGEMGDCELASEEIVQTWCNKAKIEMDF